jgi:hypothetical protein
LCRKSGAVNIKATFRNVMLTFRSATRTENRLLDLLRNKRKPVLDHFIHFMLVSGSKCRISHFPNEHLKNLPTPTTTMKPLKQKWTGASR